jgi:MFS family permease
MPAHTSNVVGAESAYGWMVVAAGAIITCVAMGAMFALPVYLQPISDETGWSVAGISLAMTVGFIVMGIAGFGWGILSDRIGVRPVVLAASVIGSAGLLVASRATELFVFQLAYGGLIGASGGAFFAPIMAAAVGWFEKHRSLAVALVSIGGGVAPMTMTPLATVLTGAYGWRTAMLVIAIGVLIVVIPAALLLRTAPWPDAKPGTSDTTSRTMSQKSEAWRALATPQFIALAVTFFLCCAAHSGPIFHTVSYAVICGATPIVAAGIYSLEGLAGLFGRLLFGLMADRFGPQKIIVLGLAVQAAGIFAYGYATDVPVFFLIAPIVGLAYGGVMPLYAILAREYFPQRVMGTVLGAASMTSFIGMGRMVVRHLWVIPLAVSRVGCNRCCGGGHGDRLPEETKPPIRTSRVTSTLPRYLDSHQGRTLLSHPATAEFINLSPRLGPILGFPDRPSRQIPFGAASKRPAQQ